MTDSLEDIFRKNMPYVDESMAISFAAGMQAYHEQFKVFRDESINYGALPEYQSARQHVLQAPKESFWVYSPHFRKTMALAIELLFGTKITKMSLSAWCWCIVFIDECMNRWTVVIDNPAENGEGVRKISMFFPRDKTQICTHVKTRATPVSELTGPDCPALVVLDVDLSKYCSE
jgi:hypothetical protein